MLLLDCENPAEALRMARTHKLLTEHPTMTKEQLAESCGIASALNFRRVCQRNVIHQR